MKISFGFNFQQVERLTMKKKNAIRVNILLSCIILFGYVAMGISSYYTYSRVIKNGMDHISELTAANIYSGISNELTKPIVVSLTMANDSFLKNWIINENKIHEDGLSNDNTQQDLTDYLSGLKDKYGYNSVFLVSEKSGYYYHYEGINKKISKENAHDIWYYNFIASKSSYDLEIDEDEVNQNQLSVFINCRIEDDDGNLLGVTGVGLEIEQIQKLLYDYKNQYNIEAMLFNKSGIVQIHTNTDLIDKQDVFQIKILNSNKDKILNNDLSPEVIRFNDNRSIGYFSIRYIDDLDWYLLIKRDTSILSKTFNEQITNEAFIAIFIIVIVLKIASIIVKNYEKQLLQIARMDSLTDLPNRRGFNEDMINALKSTKDTSNLFVYIFDIDNFKNVNDNKGHLYGDLIIKQMGGIAYDMIGKEGMIARWGGDEFAGFIRGSREQVLERVETFLQKVRQTKEFEEYGITVSLGLTYTNHEDTVDSILMRADKALYQVKEKGKDHYVFF